MNQLTWTYIADDGGKHVIGIAHGIESGNLLIHCNNKVTLVDFKVLDSKSYSFFIDEQLCEIHISCHSPQQFSYNFEINNKVDTPRNRARQEKEKKYLYQSLAFLGTLFIAITVFIFITNSWNKETQNLATHIGKNYTSTTAKIIHTDRNEEIKYYFTANGIPQQGSFAINQNHQIPLEEGDEFLVKYESNNPQKNIIHLDSPTPHQIERYQKRLANKLDQMNVRYGDHFTCLFNQIYLLKGLDGIHDIYFQDTPPNLNSKHNQTTYAKLIQEEAITEIIQNCK